MKLLKVSEYTFLWHFKRSGKQSIIAGENNICHSELCAVRVSKRRESLW